MPDERNAWTFEARIKALTEEVERLRLAMVGIHGDATSIDTPPDELLRSIADRVRQAMMKTP